MPLGLSSPRTLPMSQPFSQKRQKPRKRASSNFTKLLITLTARSLTRSGLDRTDDIGTRFGARRLVELLVAKQEKRKCGHITLLIGAQILLTTLACTQTSSLPEPSSSKEWSVMPPK